MGSTTTTRVSDRDLAVLRAIADGRCMVSREGGSPLTIDGFRCADQFAKVRLTDAGLIALAGPAPALALLTPVGRAALAAA